MSAVGTVGERDSGCKGHILLGINGGIAAYKIPGLVSLLSQQGYRVRVVLSEAGARFVNRETLEALSGQKVYSSLWQEPPRPNSGQESPVLHIALVDEADIFLVAPATYDWIGKAASGLADDLLSTLFAAWPLPSTSSAASAAPSESSAQPSERQHKALLFAPAMNPEMWLKEALQQNIERLQAWGCQLIEPGSGFLACRAKGQGRMAEAEELYFRLESRLRFVSRAQHMESALPLRGKRILLTAGPTREPLDPVRYLSNRSSGRSGIALACAARDLGAEVTLISGIEATAIAARADTSAALAQLDSSQLLMQQLFGIHVLNCNSAAEMARHAADHFNNCDWALAVAAVCDFRSAHAAQGRNEKIKKEAGRQNFHLELTLNPDILAWWGQHKKQQKILGFALESAGDRDSETAARRERDCALKKLHNKNADAIVLNRPGNLDNNCAEAELFFADSADSSERGRLLALQDKRDFAAELLLLLCERWL